LESVFLTNEFDDPLEGWDRSRYVPCLRTDDLVLKLDQPKTAERLRAATGVDVGDLSSVRAAVGKLFEHFVAKGARACAVSLPPSFVPARPHFRRCDTPVRRAVTGLPLRPEEAEDVRRALFWTIAEFCSDFKLPFDLMIGPIRNVYANGVEGGRDLFDRRVSLHDYQELFNSFADCTFPVSTLSPDAGAELVAYSWIFPNVVPMGHWWYSNTPVYIASDLKARLGAVPRSKIVGYYSDAYKLEFVAPKFRMFERELARILAQDFVSQRRWSQESALELARDVLIENPCRIFKDTGAASGSKTA
jgi:glucuronate isomerase